MRSIKIIKIISEIGAGTRGSSLGFDALRVVSYKLKNDFFKRYSIENVEDQNHLLLEETDTPSARYIEGMYKVYQAQSKKIKDCLEEGGFPLVLAADHATAGGTIAGIKMQYPEKRLGLIWIDAHSDIHSPYTSPSGNVHGMPVATAINEDNKENKIREVEEKAIQYWDSLKNMGGIAPKVKPEDVVYFGVRDIEDAEQALMEKNKIKNFTVDSCRQNGFVESTKLALEQLSQCDLIYISFDVDSMDSEKVSDGTGTPVPNGFLPEEVNQIIETTFSSKKVVCFEMVEINPILDSAGNKMAETAFDILIKTSEHIEKYLG